MLFTKTTLATAALCLGLSLQVSAHAVISPALGLQGKPVRNDAQRPKKGKECGNTDIAKTFDSSTAVPVAANGTFPATITNFNGGVDGSRQVTALVDASGTGKSFVPATVLQNGDRDPKGTGSQPLVVQLPAGTTCTGGASKNKCLVSFTTAGNFGNCVVVQQGASAASGTGSGSGTSQNKGGDQDKNGDQNKGKDGKENDKDKGMSKGKGNDKAATASGVGSKAAAPSATSGSSAATSASGASTTTVSASKQSGSTASKSGSVSGSKKTQAPAQVDEELLKELQELEKELQQKIQVCSSYALVSCGSRMAHRPFTTAGVQA
ncbi:hypothetical protein C8Q77DRAFT_479535 [Trametes polyzona]|nr:hypothetical protein C8Q77DRAFT_479535 [Trametes polyzona]